MLCSFFCGAIPDLFAVKTLVKSQLSRTKVLIFCGFPDDFSQRYILCEKSLGGQASISDACPPARHAGFSAGLSYHMMYRQWAGARKRGGRFVIFQIMLDAGAGREYNDAKLNETVDGE